MFFVVVFVSLIVGFVVSAAVVLAAKELYNFFFPRKDAVRFAFPFQNILLLALYQDIQLDYIDKVIKEEYPVRGKKTFVLQTPILPCFVGTTDVRNVQYILKDRFDNFGKTGDSFKPRLQGLLGNGIFNSDGKQWYAHRKTSAHLFKMNKFKGSILDIFNDDLNQLIEVFLEKSAEQKGSDGIVVDIHDYLHRFTLESISRIAFGISLGAITNPKIAFAQDFDYCTMCINDSFLNPFWLLERYLTPKGWKYFYCLYRINNYAHKIISDRRAELEALQKAKEARGDDAVTPISEKLARNDLLTLYLDQQSFHDMNDSSSSNDTFMEPTDANMRDVILNMIIAGRDTTAQALSWSFYRMCIHPETQQKLRDEVNQVFQAASSEDGGSTYDQLKQGNGIGTVSWDTLQSLRYMEAFCMEVLRLHPSVPKEAKEVFSDDVLPDGTPVKKGDMVAFLPWSMGRDHELWGEDAEEFHPERFLDEKNSVAKPSPFKFIAFQAGPRTCLGQNFALLEMKCVLSRLVLMYDFSLAQDPAKVTYGLSLTLPIKDGLKVRIRPLA